MLLIRARVRPCSSRWRRSSEGRATTILPSSVVTFISGWATMVSWPFGPLTEISCPLTLTWTFAGIVTGCFPIRDIIVSSAYGATSAHLPDEGQHFAAHAFTTRLRSGHHAFRRGHDRNAHAAEHPGNFALPSVHAAARRADALEARDDRLADAALAEILEVNSDDLFFAFRHAEVLDVAFCLQHTRHFRLEAGIGHADVGMAHHQRVANARQQIGNRVVDTAHRSFS